MSRCQQFLVCIVDVVPPLFITFLSYLYLQFTKVKGI